MVNKITRYLLHQLLTATAFAAIAVTLIIWLTQSLRLIELVIDHGASFWVFGRLMLLTLPTFLPLVFPFGLAAGIMFVYMRQIQESELIVMRAVGLSQMQLARPALILATISVVMLFIFAGWITPWANRQLILGQYMLRNDMSVLLLRDGAFTSLGDGLTVYVRERENSGEMRGLLVEDNRRADHATTIIADRGIVTTVGGVAKAIAFNGTRQEFNWKTGKLSQLDFDNYTLDLSELNGNSTMSRWSEPRERNLTELWQPVDSTLTADAAARLRTEFHERFVTPLLAPAFTMIVLTVLLLSSFDRRGMAKRVSLAALAVAGLQGLVMSVGNLSVKHPIALIALYALTVVPIVLGLFLLLQWRIGSLPKTSMPMLSNAGAQS